MIVVAVAVGLIAVPADFEIEARGQLQPLLRRDVFASSDGVVRELRVDHDQKVKRGDPLVLLDNPQLDLEFKRTWGEIQTVRKRMLAVQAARALSPTVTDAAVSYHRLAADEAELKERLGNLQQQLRILEGQQALLTLSSPIDGVGHG